jgi:hypothetical protein
MKRKTITLTSTALLLCVAAWLTGRYSATVRHSTAPHRDSASGVRKFDERPVPPQALERRLSIPAEALQNAETLEAWLTACLGDSEIRPGELWIYGRALQQIRMAERFSELDDDSVRRLAAFFEKREAREHFAASQTFTQVIDYTLTELSRRDRTALAARIMRAASDDENWKYLLLGYTRELTLRDRLALAQQISRSHPQTEETPEPWEAAFRYLRPGEIDDAVRIAESLPEERRRKAFAEIVSGAAGAPDIGPLLARVYPEKAAEDLPTRQMLNLIFRTRLASDESGADCAAWLEAQPLPPRLRAAAATELVSVWMQIDTPAAVAWRLQHSQAEDRSAVLEQIVSKWVDHTPMIRAPLEARTADAAEWLQANAAGVEADRARAVLARSWSILKEPEAGAAWAAAITDLVLREKTQQVVGDPVKASLEGQSWQTLAAAEICSQK